MKSKSRSRRAVAAPKSQSGRTPLRFAPRFVELEGRDVPATLYVDPLTAGSNPGDQVAFNAGNPGEVDNLSFGTQIFADFATAFAATQADGQDDTINLSYGNIAINNAAGKQYVVAPADGALTLNGSGAGATILQLTDNTASEFGSTASVFLASGAGAKLNVQNLYFDGGAPTLQVGQAFRYEDGATGTISKVSASLVIFTPVGANSGTVVVATGTGTNVTVTGSTFTDYGTVGVGVDAGATATITGNTFNGGGPGAYIIYGVQVSDGSSALISGNTFTNHLGAENGTSSGGVLISGDDGNNNFTAATATIIGNRFSNNTVGVLVGTPDASNNIVDPSTALIQHNNILGNDTGILTATTSVVNAVFNWWGDPSGPLATGNNTPAGDNPTGLGNPVDTQVQWKDAAVSPNGGVLQGPTPVAVAATSADYVAGLTPATVTVSGPANPVNTNALVFTVTFSEPVTGFGASDITVTNGTVTSVVPNAGGDVYTVTVKRTSADNVSVTVPASTSVHTALFAGISASNTATATFQFTRGFSAGGDTGSLQPYFGVDQNLATRTGVVPFAATFTGGVRTASADINGDGVLDVIVGTGAGIQNQVKIYDGATTALIASFSPYEATFKGGVFVAAGDVNGDGVPDVSVSPDQSGGPRIRVLNGAAINTQKTAYTSNAAGDQFADFFSIEDPNFRGGVRVGMGDINDDGFADIISAAGFGGGPRIAGFSGKGITPAATPVKLFADFFAFDTSLRDGSFVAGGDVNGDGFADIVAGAGNGGGPLVKAFSGKAILTDTQTLLANFTASNVTGGAANRGGVRVAAKDLNNDGKADIVVAPGHTGGSTIGVFNATNPGLNGGGLLNPDQAVNLFGNFTNGAFVG
jgi:Bacterial Ig-like domain/FG-GAP-like repeat/Right handed beta helix region